MIRFLVPLIIIAVGITIYALIESIGTPAQRARVLPKGVWIIVILLLPPIGGLLWLIFGKPREPRNTGSWDPTGLTGPSGGGGAFSRPKKQPAPRPKSPDDDDEFLRQVDIQRQQKLRAAELDAREAELRAREEHLKGMGSNSSDAGSDDSSNPDADRPEKSEDQD